MKVLAFRKTPTQSCEYPFWMPSPLRKRPRDSRQAVLLTISLCTLFWSLLIIGVVLWWKR